MQQQAVSGFVAQIAAGARRVNCVDMRSGAKTRLTRTGQTMWTPRSGVLGQVATALRGAAAAD